MLISPFEIMLILAAANEHHGPPVSMDAPVLFGTEEWFIPITSTFFVGMLMAVGFFVFFRIGLRNMAEVPGSLQNLIEAAIEGIENFMAGLLEPKVVGWAFPLLGTFFIFIITSNLLGLLPGIGSIGTGGHPVEGSWLPAHVEHVEAGWFRPPTSDANMTIAMALAFFVFNFWWALKYNGPIGLYQHIFGVKGGLKGALYWVLLPLFFLVGLIEVISILIRPVALNFRLFGNIFGGENVLAIMLKAVPFGMGALPFYFLEIIVGVVQAVVFTVLCVAFTATLCSHSEEHHEEEEGGHAPH